MASRKQALLIASPFDGLRGPLNDVVVMATTLRRSGFDITECCGQQATRDGILTAWRTLISQISPNDAIVIYYSGHGSLVESSQAPEEASSSEPWRYQFIVPMDFDQTAKQDFRGILDVELSLLLRETTDRTENVTIIFDCCYSGRISRDPMHGDAAVPRQLPEIRHHDISACLERLRRAHRLWGKTYVEGNPHAVRIAAAATTETAWEYQNAEGNWAGAMTESLSRAIEESVGRNVSWRTTMLRVSQLVSVEFPLQHPQVEGPDTRLQFSLQHRASSGALPLKIENSLAMIQAGRVSGIQVGNLYSVMPLGTEAPSAERQIGEAIVTHVVGFKARAELSFDPGRLPKEGALVFIRQEALARWPVAIPFGLRFLREAIDQSKYLRNLEPGEGSASLVEFQQLGDIVRLRNSQGLQIASHQIPDREPLSVEAYDGVIRDAERLARARHLQTLRCERPDEQLVHELRVVFGTVEDGKRARTIMQDGTDYVAEHDDVYISLENKGDKTIYVWVFDINAAGKVSVVSTSNPRGIELPPNRGYVVGERQFGLGLVGLPMSWPDGVARGRPVDEELVLVVVSSPVDLSGLEGAVGSYNLKGRTKLCNLEQLALHLATGGSRDVGREDCGSPYVKFDVIHIPFNLRPIVLPWGINRDGQADGNLQPRPPLPFPTDKDDGDISAGRLPIPEAIQGWEELPRHPPHKERVSKNVIGAVIRAAKGVPPCVWVVNEHDEEITVVVSKYRPSRLLTGGGLNASATGGGFDFSTTTFSSPATRKTLAPRTGKEESIAVFPLWTRKEGCGVISIFKGPGKELYIENDRVPAGATAYFTNNPNMRMVGYSGEKLSGGTRQ